MQIGEETFGQRMARLRQTAGFTQRALAAELGISQRMVAYYEAQADHPPAHLLPLLADVLGASADELLGLKPVRHEHKIGWQRLERRLKQIAALPANERKQLLGMIDMFLEKDRQIRRSGRISVAGGLA